MPDVVILRGISGSGKTTFAKRMPRVRISRDDLRRLLFGIEGKAVLTSEQEKKVTKFQREWIERELLEGNDAMVKSDLWDEHIDGKFNVLMHFDDRNRVVNGLRRKGIKVAQVAQGDF